MKKYLIWGTGVKADDWFQIYNMMPSVQCNIIVGFIDNDPKKWGTLYKGIKIYSPGQINNIEYDYITIWAKDAWDKIYMQLTQELGIPVGKIKDIFQEYKEELENKYVDSSDEEVKKYVDRIKNSNMLNMFYHDEEKNYSQLYEVYRDESAGLNFSYMEGKRIYLSKTFKGYIKKDGKLYVQDFYREQDLKSPHLYESENVYVKQDSVVIDAGVCEGNFSLHNIDKIKKLYLIECDDSWMEALKYTFMPYGDKVVFCDKFLSNYDSDNTICIDSLVKEPINFIKMDIEGEELRALEGAKRTLKQSKDIGCSICSYHRHNDQQNIENFLTEMGFATEVSEGYMLFICDPYVCKNPELRRGIVRGKK